MNRLSRDNVAQVVVLEVIGAPRQARGSTRLCVANTHLYSNVQRPDVKLWQALSLLQELEQFVVQRDLALLLCGDLNRYAASPCFDAILTFNLALNLTLLTLPSLNPPSPPSFLC